MRHIDLLPPHPRFARTHKELRIEERSRGVHRSYALPEIAPEHFHGAVEIADPHAENDPREEAEAFGVHFAQKGISTLPAPAHDERIRFTEGKQLVEILRFELSVTVHES